MHLRGSCLSLLVLIALAGCGPGRYFIPAREARRAAEALRAEEETVVRGVEPDGREVRLRLRAGDSFLVTHPGYEHEHGGPDLLARVADVDRVEIEPGYEGRGRVYLGLGLLGGTLVRGVIVASVRGGAMSAVPFAGPIDELVAASQFSEWQDPDRLGVAFSALGLALQALGAGLVIWGVVDWEPDRGSPLSVRF